MAAPAGQQVSQTPVGRGSPVFQRQDKEGFEQISPGKTNPVPATSGPLSVLAQNKYYDANTSNLKYPLDVGTVKFPHFLRFHINIPGKSSFSTEFQDVPGLTRTDYNRQIGGQLGGDRDVFSTSAVVGGAITGGMFAATQLLNDAAKNLVDGTPKQAVYDASGALFGGIATAGIAATILANIDVTRKTKRLVQSIDLYIPDQVIMQQQNKYGEVSLTSALGMAGLAGQGAKATAGSISESLKNLGRNIAGVGAGSNKGGVEVKDSAGAGAFLAETLSNVVGGAAKELGIVGEGIENVLLQSYGIAQNPQVEVLFDTIDNRTFEFNFAFHPRNQKEAEAVIGIVRMFRFHAAPEIARGSGGRYFIPPSEFDIEYRFKPSDGENDILNENLHKFATCVLEAIDVNYVGQSGQFLTFKDGIPANIEMRLRFKEVEIMHKDLIKAGY